VTNRPLRILLVEDDVADACRIEAALRDAADRPADVITVASLSDARKSAADSNWDVVFLDLGLPDSQGIEAFRAVQEFLPTTPIVVLTGIEDPTLAQEAIHEGAQDFLAKGALSAELLSRTIRCAIDRKRAHRTLDEERQRPFAVLDALPMFVYLQSPDHTIPFANKKFRELFGDVEGRACYEVFHGRKAPCDECPPMRVQETGEPEVSEWTSLEGRTYAVYDQVFPGSGDAPLTLKVGLDVTEQKRARHELARSESRFRRLAENAPDVIYRYRIALNPGFDYISPAVTDVSGYTPEEYYADPLLGIKVVHPEDRHLLEGLAHGRLPAKRTHDVRWFHKDGHVRWTEDHHIPVYDESGRLVAIEGVARDITEWKRSQEALAKSEERHRLLFEHAGIGIGYYTPEGELIGYNRVAAAYLGGEPEDFAGKTIVEIFGEEKGTEYLRRIAHVARFAETVTYEDYAELPTGPKWFLSTYSRVDGPDGEVLGVEVFSEDITERKTSETALRESERRFRELGEMLPETVYECDLTGRITFANRAGFERFGYTKRDLERGLNALELLVHEDRDRAEENVRRILDGERIGGTEYIALKRDGSTFPAIVHTASALKDGEAVGFRGILVDVSEERRAREALQTADEIVSALPAGILIYRYREPEALLLASGNAAASPFVDLEKHVGTELKDHWPPAMVERLKKPLLRVAREGEVYDREVTVESSAGRFFFHVRAFRIPGDRVVIAFEDVTERRKAQTSVVEWKNRYEGAVQASGHVLYDWDSETNAVTYGGDFERILGYTEDEMTGGLTHWIELIHPDDRQGFEQAIEQLRQSHEPAHLLYRVRRKEGEYIHVEDDGNFIVDAHGKPVRMLGFVKDVTERRRSSERIEESERRYRGMVELSPVGIVTVDLEGVVTSCNKAFEEMTGYSEEELVGKHFTKLPPARLRDVAKYVRMFGAVMAGRTPDPFESTWTRKDGTHEQGEVRVALMKREGKLFGVQVIVQDVTERNRALEALRQSEARYRSLFENSVLGIYRTTPDGRILVANPALVRMLGCDSFEELAQRNLEERGYEPETPRAEFKERIERLGSLVGWESAWKRRDGTTLHVRENARVVRDEEGNVLYYEGTIEDVTERKEVEHEAEALRERLELTQYSIDSTEAIVLWVLPDGHFLFVNEAASWMLAYSREELLGKAVWEVDSEYPKERRAKEWEALKRLGTEVSERTFRRRDGSEFPVEITAQYIRFKGKEYEFAVAFDISKRKHLEAQLRQSQRLESIGTLASGVAHEINNPLTGIINYAQLISDRIEDEKLKRFADGIKEEGDRVAGIVRNLLSFSRQDKEHSSPARMIDIVNAALSLYTALLRRDQIELHIDVPEGLPKIGCRSQEIQQILINLLTNARDSLNLRFPDAHRDKRIAVFARVVKEDDREWIRLLVEDHGQGIPPELIDRVFDPFFTTKPRDQGTGLGLSISYGLVRDHGGRMNVESVPNGVTRFTVDLPIGTK